MNLRIHAYEPFSRVNGPGARAVVWVQGCSLGCQGCFNPSTHDAHGGSDKDTADLETDIANLPSEIEGISISGGEPFQQPEALLDLLQRIDRTRLSVIIFTGYSLPEIHRISNGDSILQHVDVLIAGRYVHSRHLGRGLLGSSNQRIHLLTTRYKYSDFESIPCREVIIHADGTCTITGINPLL